jgi:hypothetical protein
MRGAGFAPVDPVASVSATRRAIPSKVSACGLPGMLAMTGRPSSELVRMAMSSGTSPRKGTPSFSASFAPLRAKRYPFGPFTAATFAGQGEFGNFTDAGGIAAGIGKYVGKTAGVMFAIALIDAALIGASAVRSRPRRASDARGAGAGRRSAAERDGVPAVLCNDKPVLGPWVNNRWVNYFTGAMTVSGNAPRAAVQELTRAYQELATKNAKNLTAAMQALAAVRSPAEFIELQQRLIKEGVEAAVTDSRHIAQLTTAVFTAAFEPVKKQLEKSAQT